MPLLVSRLRLVALTSSVPDRCPGRAGAGAACYPRRDRGRYGDQHSGKQQQNQQLLPRSSAAGSEIPGGARCGSCLSKSLGDQIAER